MDKKQNNNFKKATQKLKNNRFLKSIIFASLLIANAKLTPDLVAEENKQPPQIETIIDNPQINIECEEDTAHLAYELKGIIEDLRDDNETTAKFVELLEKNNITFKISKTDYDTNGYYILNGNTIYIPQNNIPDSTNENYNSKVASLKRTIIHETVHFLQDKNGVFKDCNKLSPLESCIVNAFAELDAINKSFLIQEPQDWTSDKLFNLNRNLIPCLEGDMKIALNKSKKQIPTTSNIHIEDVIQKMNLEGIDAYTDIPHIIQTIKDYIPKDLYEKIEIANKEYFDKLNNQKLIANNTNNRE